MNHRGTEAPAFVVTPAGLLDGRLSRSRKIGNAPACRTFEDFLRLHARVLQRDGTGGAFSTLGRAPLALIIGWLDKIIRNTIGSQFPVHSSQFTGHDELSRVVHRPNAAPGGSAPSGRKSVNGSAELAEASEQGTTRQSSSWPGNQEPGEAVEIDGLHFTPGALKGATLAVGGGAQWGKTILELNLMAYATAIRFLSVGNYLPDRPKVEEIVGQKFRPNVLDLYPWMAEMIQIGKTQNASGKTIDRKESFTVTDGERKSFGNFCGMHKPPTSITIDLALLDEVDDIPDRNIGYVDARMTNSPVHLTCFIGTQRVAGAGQNARLKASSCHVMMVPCPACGREWCLEEEFPRCVRVHSSQSRDPSDPSDPCDPIISPEMGHDRLATYYVACPECGAELSRDTGRYAAKHPDRIAQARLGVRVSQLNISAIRMQEIIGAWYAAFEDPSGNALAAFYCDRIAIPNAGAAQPITQAVLDDCRKLGLGETVESAEPYAMSLASSQFSGFRELSRAVHGSQSASTQGRSLASGRETVNDSAELVVAREPRTVNSGPRVAGMDMGPRCWFWCDEVRSPLVSACVWAELIASGSAPARVPILMNALSVSCLFLDAGGEPDLTKRLVLALNGLENYRPPMIARNDLLKARLSNLGVGVSWDGERARWNGIRAAAVLFVAGEAKGIEQTIGFTQEGRIYPLIKCNRSESIQTAVNDFLTPAQGVLEVVHGSQFPVPGSQFTVPGPAATPGIPATSGRNTLNREPGTVNTTPTSVDPSPIRRLPRARLPETYIGPGVSQAVLDGHLLNLRKERDPRTGEEDWIEGVENHLGLAKCYARLAQTVVDAGSRVAKTQFSRIAPGRQTIGHLGMGQYKPAVIL